MPSSKRPPREQACTCPLLPFALFLGGVENVVIALYRRLGILRARHNAESVVGRQTSTRRRGSFVLYFVARCTINSGDEKLNAPWHSGFTRGRASAILRVLEMFASFVVVKLSEEQITPVFHIYVLCFLFILVAWS